MIKEKNPNFKGLWAKYSKYEIIENNNEFYIKPTKKSESQIYDVFDKEKEILVDFLMLGKKAYDYKDKNDVNCILMSKEKSFQTEILNFVNKYGMLGILTLGLKNNNILSAGKAIIQQSNEVTELTPNDYIKPYFVSNKDIQKIDFNNGITPDVLNVYGSKNPVNESYIDFSKNEDFKLVFSNEYSEKVSEILLLAKSLYHIFYLVEKAGWTEDEAQKIAYESFAKDFVPTNLSFEFSFMEEKRFLNWDFNSLFQAIELIFAFNETNDRKELKMCKHCSKPFIAKNIKADYDTISCRNVENVYRNRAKKKNA